MAADLTPEQEARRDQLRGALVSALDELDRLDETWAGLRTEWKDRIAAQRDQIRTLRAMIRNVEKAEQGELFGGASHE